MTPDRFRAAVAAFIEAAVVDDIACPAFGAIMPPSPARGAIRRVRPPEQRQRSVDAALPFCQLTPRRAPLLSYLNAAPVAVARTES